METIVRWLPLLAIAVVFVAFGSLSVRSYPKQIDRVQRINDEILATNREIVAELRQTEQILKDRE